MLDVQLIEDAFQVAGSAIHVRGGQGHSQSRSAR